MATRLIGTDSTNPRLPDAVILATQGLFEDDLAAGNMPAQKAAEALVDANEYTDSKLQEAKDYTDAQISELVIDPDLIAFADEAETLDPSITNKAVSPAGLHFERPYLDARVYGADPTATAATNATAINTALTDAAGTGMTVRLPAGTLDVNTAIVATASTTLQGDRNGTTIRMTGPGRVIRCTNTPNFTLADVTIDCNKAGVADDGSGLQHGVFVNAADTTGSPGTTLRRVKVVNARVRGICVAAGTTGTHPLDVSIVDCKVTGSGGAGIFVQNCTRSLIEACDVSANELWGIHVSGGTNTTVRDNWAHDQAGTSANRGHGIVVNNGTVGAIVDGNVCWNNTIGPTTWGIVIGINAKRFIVSNNRCYDNAQNMTIDVAEVAAVNNPIDTRGVIANNTCTGATVGNGLHVNQADGLSIVGNHCSYNAQWGIQIYGRNCVVAGNTSHHNGRSGIAFSQDLTAPLVSCGPHVYGVNHVYANNTAAGTWTDFQSDILTNGPVRHGTYEGAAPQLLAKTGEYWSYPATKTTAALASGNLYTHPVWVPTTMTLDRIAAEVTVAAAGSALTLGIYNDDGNGDPGTLLLDAGPISAASVAVLEATISQIVQGGRLYHFAVLCQGGAPTVRIFSSAWNGRAATLATAFTTTRTGRLRGAVVGTALPNPAATTANNSPNPVVAVRIG